MYKKILIGADPEVFLIEKETKKVISAVGLIPGSKHDPFLIGDNPFEAIQTDNIMAEFCQEPTDDPVKFFNDSQRILNYIRSLLPESLDISIQASTIADESELQSEQAKLFGCDPDFNAWTLRMNESPSSKTNLRTAGGHVHIGYENPEFLPSVEIIKALDLYLTVPSLLLDPDDQRRQMYGKAGAFRVKNYGVELRTLSNFWIKDQESVNWVFNQVMEAINVLNNSGGVVSAFMSADEQMSVQLAINNADKKLAQELCDSFKIKLFNQVLQTT